MNDNKSIHRLHPDQAARRKTDGVFPRDKLIRIQFKHEDLAKVRVRMQENYLVLDRAQKELMLLSAVVFFLIAADFLKLLAFICVLFDVGVLLDNA